MTTLHADAERLIAMLGLTPHPEGGFFRETVRGTLVLGGLPHGAPRSSHTCIYYLLPAGVFSPLHRVRSDEVWHHYAGDPVELHLITPGGHYRTHLLGPVDAQGKQPHVLVPADHWQAAVVRGRTYALCGCTVAPGFDFADFQMPGRAELLRLLPQHASVVTALTRGCVEPE